jgi:hypothetical protein
MDMGAAYHGPHDSRTNPAVLAESALSFDILDMTLAARFARESCGAGELREAKGRDGW